MDKVVQTRPVVLESIEPGDTVRVTSLHLHDVGDRMCSPTIGGITLDRVAAIALGVLIKAVLLVAEGAQGLKVREARYGAGPLDCWTRLTGRVRRVG